MNTKTDYRMGIDPSLLAWAQQSGIRIAYDPIN